MSKKESKQKIVAADEPELVVRSEGSSAGEMPPRPGVPIPEVAGVMAIRNTVVFPGTVTPLQVGREKSRALLDEALADQKVIVLVSQRDGSVEDPSIEDLYDHGTAAAVLKLLDNEDGNQTIIVHGLVRVRVDEFTQTVPFFQARVQPLTDLVEEGQEMEARILDVRQKALRIVELAPNVPEEARLVINGIEAPGPLTDFLGANVPLDIPVKQRLLGETSVLKRLAILETELHRQVEVLELSDKIQDQVRSNIDKSQREFFLREQLKAIQKELGQVDDQTAEVEELRRKLDAAGMSEAIRTECDRELGRLERISPASPEYSVIRTYLDVMTELPWEKTTTDKLDINRARRVLDKDHYDLQKVKKRILEYLAVRKLAPDSRGPLLCFVGPPGVGKTSLGQSIARALGRKFIRMSLGGMRDEAELRGHRRTYIGAMCGRILQELRKAGSRNPVFMLDELDKVGSDFRGDPSSALLEILDPAQNFSFQDHYLNVPFDLSKVMFIATANIMSTVPPALRDRMEIIEIPGYTLNEKVHIAERYLVLRQLTENGLTAKQLRFHKTALRRIARRYTREAGVRELERQVGAICRGVAALVAAGKAKRRTINNEAVVEFLGPPMYESEVAQRTATPGVATGLAYTAYGGEIIFVEATSYPGSGQLILTGQIGEVMRESARAALSLIRSRCGKMGLCAEDFATRDIHVHVPAGAVPKDGPSAGVAIVTAISSLLLGKSVRSDVAMTGEITLRGLILPIGGMKEKVLAASLAGIHTIILPERNRKDLLDVPPEAKKKIKFIFAKTIEEVMHAALVGGCPCLEPGKAKKKTKKKAKKKTSRKSRKS